MEIGVVANRELAAAVCHDDLGMRGIKAGLPLPVVGEIFKMFIWSREIRERNSRGQQRTAAALIESKEIRVFSTDESRGGGIRFHAISDERMDFDLPILGIAIEVADLGQV